MDKWEFDQEISSIKENCRLADVARDYGIQIGRGGFCHCPFHQGDRTASMKIYVNNTFHCFGCGAHGTVIDFVMKMDGVSFLDACRQLTGKELSPPTRRQAALRKMARMDHEKEEQRLKKAILEAGDKLAGWRNQYKDNEPPIGEVPPDIEVALNDKLTEAVHAIPKAEYRYDELMREWTKKHDHGGRYT